MGTVMASTTKHETTHPTTGQKATRTSENRVYSHAVWSRYTEAQAAASVARQTKYINSGYGGRCQLTDAEKEAGIQHWREYQQRDVEKGWTVNGWCSREDLARRSASQLAAKGYEVVITEAVVVQAKTARPAPASADEPTHHRVDEQWRNPDEDAQAGCL